MTPQEFIAKWKKVSLSERSACQQHFLDLCELVNHPKPAAADPEGTSFTFERGCRKLGGKIGWADVWKKDFFGWEYKGKRKDLERSLRPTPGLSQRSGESAHPRGLRHGSLPDPCEFHPQKAGSL